MPRRTAMCIQRVCAIRTTSRSEGFAFSLTECQLLTDENALRRQEHKGQVLSDTLTCNQQQETLEFRWH